MKQGIVSLVVAAAAAFVVAARSPQAADAPAQPIAAAASPATQPATPASQPAGPATAPGATLAAAGSPLATGPVEPWQISRPFPPAYDILLTRNVFSLRRVVKTDGPPRPEAGLAFRGAGLLDDQYTALVEDLGSKAVRRLKAGEPVAAGKVKAITLSYLEYEAGGKVARIAVGQNLAGATVPPPTTAPSAPPPGGPPGGPGNPNGPGGPNGPVPPNAKPAPGARPVPAGARVAVAAEVRAE